VPVRVGRDLRHPRADLRAHPDSDRARRALCGISRGRPAGQSRASHRLRPASTDVRDALDVVRSSAASRARLRRVPGGGPSLGSSPHDASVLCYTRVREAKTPFRPNVPGGVMLSVAPAPPPPPPAPPIRTGP
jgi:hypothetical protein